MAEQTAACPKCGRTIPASAPKQLCPACLVRTVFESEADETPHAALEMPAPAAPDELVGHYRLLDQIGRGGMGVVFRARDLRLSRIVALKLLLTGRLASEIEVKRFRAESEAAAHLEHSNIVPIYEVGEDRGWPFFTMKLVEPGSLADCLRRQRERLQSQPELKPNSAVASPESTPFDSPRAIAQLMIKVGQAVHFAHQHGILHRDLKPANILLDTAGEPFVTDFGLARRLESEAGMTSNGAVLGTPSYLAPEVAGAGSSEATIASDIYSLGAILYELLAGRPPFEAASVPLLLRKIADENPLPPSRARSPQPGAPSLDRDLETICLKCLAKNPTERYTSARALVEDLERWLRAEPILARPTSLAEQAAKWARRNPAWTLVLLLLLLAPLAVISVLVAGNARVRHAQELTRLNLYAADMQVVQATLEDANLGPAQRILEGYRPRHGDPDLRGFEWRYLWNRARSGQLRVLRAHSQPVRTLQFSPNGNWLASLEAGRAVWFWNTTTWRPERALDWSGANYHQFCWISFSPDSATVVVTQDDGYAPLLEAQTLTSHWCLRTSTPADRSMPRVLWSPRGTRLAFSATNAAGDRFTAVLDWQAFESAPGPASNSTNEIVSDTTLPLNPIGYPQAPMLRLAAVDTLHGFAPDGHLLAGRAGQLIDFDVEHGGRETVIASAHHFDYCERSADARFLAGYNDELKYRHSILIDQYVPADTWYWEMIGHEGEIRCLSISPDSKKILSGSADHTARVWDAATRKAIAVLRGHADEVTAVAWSPDSRLIATGSKDRTVMLWDGQNTNSAADASEPINAAFPPCVISDDGAALVASTSPGAGASLVIREISTGETNACAFPELWPLRLSSPRGQLMAVECSHPGSAELCLREQPSGTNTLLARMDTSDGAGRSNIWTLSSDQRWIARGDELGGVAIWRIDAKRMVEQLGNSCLRQTTKIAAFAGNPVAALAFADRSGTLAVLRRDRAAEGAVSLWDPPAGKELILSTAGAVSAFAWSADGQTLALGCEDHSIQLWDAARRQLSRALAGHKHGVEAVAFSNDGRTLASGDGRTIKLWHTATGRETLTLYRDVKLTDPLLWLAFSRSDNCLLAGDKAGRVQVFLAPHTEP